jgi:hypothetical protein
MCEIAVATYAGRPQHVSDNRLKISGGALNKQLDVKGMSSPEYVYTIATAAKVRVFVIWSILLPRREALDGLNGAS